MPNFSYIHVLINQFSIMRTTMFKKHSTDIAYYNIKSSIQEFLYDYADVKFNEKATFKVCFDLKRRTKSKAHIANIITKCNDLLCDAPFAFDLPEHPEKHNGFANSENYISDVMKILGFAFVKPKK